MRKFLKRNFNRIKKASLAVMAVGVGVLVNTKKASAALSTTVTDAFTQGAADATSGYEALIGIVIVGMVFGIVIAILKKGKSAAS